MRHLVILASALLVSTACEALPVGSPCEATGSGFQRQDPCEEMCIEWEITCPDGSTVIPDVCSGALCGTTGGCPTGQTCMQIDSFAANSRCMPDTTCP